MDFPLSFPIPCQKVVGRQSVKSCEERDFVELLFHYEIGGGNTHDLVARIFNPVEHVAVRIGGRLANGEEGHPGLVAEACAL